jgi:hypothetical protein
MVIMKRPTLTPRIVILAVALVVTLVSLSCDSSAGMGVGVGYPARWGGGTSGPPVFAGGPSY